MPRITINEVDLTSASYQLSSTDIVFVPGKSIKNDVDTQKLVHELVLCESVSEFENKFGTTPYCSLPSNVVANFRNAPNLKLKWNSADVDEEGNGDGEKGKETYKAWCDSNKLGYGNTFVCIKSVALSDSAGEKTDKTPNNILLQTSKQSNITLEKLGLVYNDDYFTNGCSINVGDTIVVSPEYDMSYVYAKELLTMGLPVMYCLLGQNEDLFDIAQTIYSANDPEGIMDKGEYSFKYLTSGGYPSFSYVYNDGHVDGEDKNGEIWINGYSNAGSFYNSMLSVAAGRGDCVALIDPEKSSAGAYPSVYVNENKDVLTDEDYAILTSGYNTYLQNGSVWDAAKQYFGSEINTEYGAMFIPWASYTTTSSYYYTFSDGSKAPTSGLGTVVMPPSFGYLKALAKSIRTNANWLAIAGVTRGYVPNIQKLDTYKLLSNTIANEMQIKNGETSINAITNIKPYGLTIWGNRTLKNNLINAQGGEDGLTATSFLNIRNLISDVKKTAYNAAKMLMFEQNTQVLWINFLAKVTPTLDKMVSGQGLSSYKVINVPTQEKAKLNAVIKIYPLYAVEDFEISIEVRDDDVEVQ